MKPRWLLIENVPFMLNLHWGEAMRFLIRELEELRFFWAYRVVDTKAFGLPQRRMRVFLLASLTEDPREVLLADEAEAVDPPRQGLACGFYWTEGNRGLGWAVDAVPPLKGGSGLRIPSPPAIWLREQRRIVTPDIRDAERLQGFEANWTVPALLSQDETKLSAHPSVRWRLVGNAVSVPVASWIGRRLAEPSEYDHSRDLLVDEGSVLPRAAWGEGGRLYSARVSARPVAADYQLLPGFLLFPTPQLSTRAVKGFFERLAASSLRIKDREPDFMADLANQAGRANGDVWSDKEDDVDAWAGSESALKSLVVAGIRDD